MVTEDGEPVEKKSRIEGGQEESPAPDANRGRDEIARKIEDCAPSEAEAGDCDTKAMTSSSDASQSITNLDQQDKDNNMPPVPQATDRDQAATDNATSDIDKIKKDKDDSTTSHNNINAAQKSNEVLPAADQTKELHGITPITTSTTTSTTSASPPFIPPTHFEASNDSSMLSFAAKNEDAPDRFMSNMSQSERKRFREKKRRSEITNAIDQLTKILIKVEPTNLIQQNNLVYSTNASDFPYRSSRLSGNSTGGSQQPLNRTEIINHAVHVLEKLFSENEERKMHIMRMHSIVHGVNGGSGNNQSPQQATMMMMPQQMIYQAPPPQAQITQVGAPPTAFTNGNIQMPIPIQMQHPQHFTSPTAFQVTSSAIPSAGPGPPEHPQGKPMVMAGTMNNSAINHNQYFQQLYFNQQLLGQQQQILKTGAVGSKK